MAAFRWGLRSLKTVIFWHVTRWRLVNRCRRFGCTVMFSNRVANDVASSCSVQCGAFFLSVLYCCNKCISWSRHYIKSLYIRRNVSWWLHCPCNVLISWCICWNNDAERRRHLSFQRLSKCCVCVCVTKILLKSFGDGGGFGFETFFPIVNMMTQVELVFETPCLKKKHKRLAGV